MTQTPDITEPAAARVVLGPVDPRVDRALRALLAAVGQWLPQYEAVLARRAIEPGSEPGTEAYKRRVATMIKTTPHPQVVGRALQSVAAERDLLDAVLRRAVENLKTNIDGERWRYVADAFLLDPEAAKQLCLRYNLDPEERV